ncbi:MAG TPA: lysine--tRNA ligase [Actinomycetota bacterium]
MSRFDDLEQLRLAKIEALRARGIDPYPVRFDRSHTAAELHERFDSIAPGEETGERVAVAGRLMLQRDSGKLAFGQLRDGTGTVQLFCSLADLGEQGLADFRALDLGDWVGAEGEVIKTKRGELSVRASAVGLLAKAIRPLPEKWAGLRDVEQRHRMRYVDLMVNEDARRVIDLRTRTVAAIRAFMVARGYTEVETPMLQPQPGGALARPFVTHMNALDMDLYMRIAPELYLKRLVVAGMERVFEINRNFRNEGLSPQHNPEFTMLEAYEAFGDYHSMMDLMEGLVSTVATGVLGTTDHVYKGEPMPLAPPFPRRRLIDLVSEATGTKLDLDMPLGRVRAIAAANGLECDPAWGAGKIVVELYERLVERTLHAPTFVLDFPREVSPLARPHREDPRFTEHFDLVIGGIEVGPAYSELNDPVDQRERLEAQMAARAAGDEEAMSLDEDFLRALEYGMPPTGGMGFGVDRFVMILADAPNIRETILFPFMRPEA